MKTTLSIVLAVSLLVFGASVSADTTISQITNNGHENTLPCMKGNYLVWQGYVDGDWEIFLYSIVTRTTTQITDNQRDDLSPRTDGDYVVWQGFDDGEWDVFLWDGSEIRAISDRGSEDLAPQVANGLVVWTSEPFGHDFVGPADVMLYDIQTETLTTLSAEVDPGNSFDDGSPNINDEVVMWLQRGDDNDVTVFVYDLANGSITDDPPYLRRDNSQRDGALGVLTRFEGNARQIFLCNNDFRRYHQITFDGRHKSYPSISGNQVAWVTNGEIFLAGCKFLSPVSPKNHGMVSMRPPTFAWEGIGYNRFKVEFSGNAQFPRRRTVTIPRRGFLKKASFTPSNGQWRSIRRGVKTNAPVFWRIKARDAGGNVSFSEASRFTIKRY